MSNSKGDITMMVSHAQRQQIMTEIKQSVDRVNTLVHKLDQNSNQIIVNTKETLEKVTDQYISILRANERIIRDKLLEADKKERAGAVMAGMSAIIIYSIAVPVVGWLAAFVPATIAIKPGEVVGVIYYKKLYRFYNWMENSKLGTFCSNTWNYISSSKLGACCANLWNACFEQETTQEITKEIVLHKIEEAGLEQPIIFNAISDVLTNQPEMLQAVFTSLRKRNAHVIILDPKFDGAAAAPTNPNSNGVSRYKSDGTAANSGIRSDVKVAVENVALNNAALHIDTKSKNDTNLSNTEMINFANGNPIAATSDIHISIRPEPSIQTMGAAQQKPRSNTISGPAMPTQTMPAPNTAGSPNRSASINSTNMRPPSPARKSSARSPSPAPNLPTLSTAATSLVNSPTANSAISIGHLPPSPLLLSATPTGHAISNATNATNTTAASATSKGTKYKH